MTQYVGIDTGGTASIDDLDRQYVAHPFTALAAHEASGPLMIVEARGCRLQSEDGTSYLDAMAGLWCVNVGYGNEEMADAIAAQSRRLSYYHSFSSMGNDVAALLAEELIALSPVPMSKVFFGNSGSDANDTQIKMVWYYNNVLGRPQKKKIISRQRGYHGVTIATAGLTGLANLHDGFDVPLPMIRHTRAPHRLWADDDDSTDEAFVAGLARDLEELILAEGPDTVAAFIAEPLQAAGGVIVPPPGYFAAIQEVLHRYDILLIADEVVCGFGRLGEWFGTGAFGMEPDLITVAKGITSAYVPLSACLISEKVWRTLADGGSRYGVFGHGYTYSAHPLAAKAALTNLSIIRRDGLVDQAASRGAYLQSRLRDTFADHPLVAEVRGQGLIGAVEFAESITPLRAFDPTLRIGPRVTLASRQHGVITRALPASDTVAFSPPFIVTESEIDEMVAGVRRGLDDVAKEISDS